MSSRSIAFLACAAMAWSAAGYKVSALRRDPRNPALWALVLSIVFPAAAFTLATPVAHQAVDRALQRPNLATLLTYSSVVAYSATTLVMLWYWQLPVRLAGRRARLVVAAYLPLLIAMAVLFLAGKVPAEHPDDFDETYARQPLIGAFLLVFVVAMGVGLAAVSHRSWLLARHVAGKQVDRPWLRRGLRLVAIGSATAGGYCIERAVLVTGEWEWSGRGPSLVGWGVACALVAAVLITIGFTLPSWGPQLSALVRRVGHAIAYLRLYPLWRVMYRALPDIALDPVGSRISDLARLHDLDFQLYRRLVEIGDGRAGLSAYMSQPAPGDPQRTGTGTRLAADALAEATRIWHAATTATAGHRAARETVLGVQHLPDESSGESADLQQQLAWLLQVSRALPKVRPHHQSRAVRWTTGLASCHPRWYERPRPDRYPIHRLAAVCDLPFDAAWAFCWRCR